MHKDDEPVVDMDREDRKQAVRLAWTAGFWFGVCMGILGSLIGDVVARVIT